MKKDRARLRRKAEFKETVKRLRTNQGLKSNDIAEKLGLSLDAIHSMLYREGVNVSEERLDSVRKLYAPKTP